MVVTKMPRGVMLSEEQLKNLGLPWPRGPVVAGSAIQRIGMQKGKRMSWVARKRKLEPVAGVSKVAEFSIHTGKFLPVKEEMGYLEMP